MTVSYTHLFSSNPGAFPFHSQIFSAANPSMALGNAYEMLSDFYKAHPEVLKKEIKGVKLMFIHAYPVGDCVMTKSAQMCIRDRYEALRGKVISGAIIDAYSQEPLTASPLFSLDTVSYTHLYVPFS